jgi:coenzyme F420-reducing hydrogenase gamma subunit
MSDHLPKKSLGIFSLTCCEGCQFALLKDFDDFEKLTNFYEVKSFRLGQEKNDECFLDVALIEGTPESEEEIVHLKNIRRVSGVVIAIGACANLGGIQSERNRLPKKFIGKDKVKRVSDLIKVDFAVPGCPIAHREIASALLDIYWGKKFRPKDYGVCFECRKNENSCLIKDGVACLGPVTRGGCDSVCVNGGQSCFGCRGALDQANFHKLKEMLNPMIGEEETNNILTIYGDVEAELNERLKNE